MRTPWIRGLLAGSFFLFSLAVAQAAEFPLSAVPDPLKSWVPWVLDEVPEAGCPHFYNTAETRLCAWPGVLELKAGKDGATFTQEWRVYRDSWVSLPGNAEVWPQSVSVDNKPVAVLSREGTPSLRLGTGTHRITGRLVWKEMPEVLTLPTTQGLLRLDIDGQTVASPVRDEDNDLHLQGRSEEEESEENTASLHVYRKVIDGVPIRVETHMRLEVSGKARELLIGRALLAGLVPQELQAPFPATLGQDGSLKVQARAGDWEITLLARHPGAVKSLTLSKAEGLVDDEEEWVFQAAPLVRSAAVEGVAAIDPQQTTLPDEWRKLPAFLVQPGGSFGLREIHRGDGDPAPDRLSLQRRLWLGFDGNTLTQNDELKGEISRATRLSMATPARLGRVDIDGQDQLITQDAAGVAGIELKRGPLRLTADSEVSAAPRHIPAVGWQHDVDKLGITLNLPPGWRLLHVSGADKAQGAWLAQWNLLDFFFVLLIALAARQLWGLRWGLLALLAMVLSYQEPGAATWEWLCLLGAVAVYRALPEGRLRRGVNGLRWLTFFALLLLMLGFATDQLRQALFPVLERPDTGFAATQPEVRRREAPVAAPAPAARLEVESRVSAQVSENSAASARLKSAASSDKAVAVAETKKTRAWQQIDPDAKVQTGPGLPNWHWHSHQLSWEGPVRQTQTLDFWLLSPWANKALTVLRLALLATLLLGATGWRGGTGGFALDGIKKLAAPAGAALLLVALLALPATPALAALPSQEQLQALREKLTRPAECLPECAEIAQMQVRLQGTQLHLLLTLDAAIDTALPLPGGSKHWLPDEARLNGKPAQVQRDEEGDLWLLLPAGHHRLELSGPLLAQDLLQLPLLLKPHQVDVQAEGWEVSGLSEESGVADTLQFARKQKSTAKAARDKAPLLPPFLTVERRLTLDLQWRVETTVRRDSPPGVPAVVSVPLLPGEAVTTAGINVRDGQVQVNLGPQAESVSWTSTLEQGPQLTLSAAPGSEWVEHWIISAASLWHLQAEGLPPVAVGDGEDADLAFRPWPGERLKLKIERPQALPGQTLTIDQSQLTVSPGARASDLQLRLVVRSSRGADHAITLPSGASLQRVSINGKPRPIRLSGPEQRQLLLPLTPGRQNIDIAWWDEQGMSWRYDTPSAQLGQASVNHGLELKLPPDRWLLLAVGPGIGPAILFWGKLLILLGLAFALGRVLPKRPGFPPLGIRQWMLLALGLTQLPWFATLIVVAWFFAFAWRGQVLPVAPAALAPEAASWRRHSPRWGFNLRQLGLVLLTLVMLGILFSAVEGGLLGRPEMQVVGNRSTYATLNWYIDHAAADLPGAWTFTLPLIAWRGLMLLWALWLAWSLLGWLKWAWQALSHGGLWRRKEVTHP